MEAIEIRRQEPDDATALHGVYSQPKVILDDRARWRAPGRVPLKRARQQPGPDHLVIPLCLEEARSGRPRLQTGRGSESPSPTILFRVYPRMAPTMKIYTGVLSNPICAAADNLIPNSTRTIGSRDRKTLPILQDKTYPKLR